MHVDPELVARGAKEACISSEDSCETTSPADQNTISWDGPIGANRFADSRESPESRESFQGSRTEPLFLRIAPWRAKHFITNRRFDAIRANRSHVIKIGLAFFLRIDFHESIRANRPDSHCESPGHLSLHPFIATFSGPISRDIAMLSWWYHIPRDTSSVGLAIPRKVSAPGKWGRPRRRGSNSF